MGTRREGHRLGGSVGSHCADQRSASDLLRNWRVIARINRLKATRGSYATAVALVASTLLFVSWVVALETDSFWAVGLATAFLVRLDHEPGSHVLAAGGPRPRGLATRESSLPQRPQEHGPPSAGRGEDVGVDPLVVWARVRNLLFQMYGLGRRCGW